MLMDTHKMTSEIEVYHELDGREFLFKCEVELSIHGEPYAPATRWQPSEPGWSEISVDKVINCYKHLFTVDFWQRCEVPEGITETLEEAIKKNDELFRSLLDEFNEFYTDY